MVKNQQKIVGHLWKASLTSSTKDVENQFLDFDPLVLHFGNLKIYFDPSTIFVADVVYGRTLFIIADGFLGSLNPRVFVPTAANVPCQDKIDGKQILNMHSRADGNRPPPRFWQS